METIKGRDKITLHGKIKLIFICLVKSTSGPIRLRLDNIGIGP